MSVITIKPLVVWRSLVDISVNWLHWDTQQVKSNMSSQWRTSIHWTISAIRHYTVPTKYLPTAMWPSKFVDNLLLFARMLSGESRIYSRGQKTVFTRSTITPPPKVNRCGQNLKHCETNVGGWPWQTLGVISAVATFWEGTKIVFLSGK